MPTRLLECVVAIIFLCAVVAYTSIWQSTKGTRRALPKNPCSVAGVPSLFLGSDQLNITPPGMEYLLNRQMREQETFRGYLFSLGWWDERQWFDIDIGRTIASGLRLLRIGSFVEGITVSAVIQAYKRHAVQVLPLQ
jgi:hypothetical protein